MEEVEPVFTTEETPERISPHILNFCKSLSDGQPVYVEVSPVADANLRDCFQVVADHQKANGGEIVFGWNIWTWPHIWIKGEHHAVWRSPDDRLIDITPKPNGVARILFVPDAQRPYDYEKNSRLANVCKSLKSDADVEALFRAEHAIYLYEEECTVDGSLEMKVDRDTYQKLILNKEFAYAKLLLKYLRPGQCCPCKSGHAFKDCHGPDFKSGLELMQFGRTL